MASSRESDQFALRLPEGMRHQVKLRAVENMRSMNAEFVYLLKKALEDGKEKESKPASQ